jgi:hypothetical protein
MAGDLITLPLRVGLRAASLFLRVTGDVAARGVELAWRMVPGFQLQEEQSRDEVPEPPSTQAEPSTAEATVEAPAALEEEEDATDAAAESAPEAPQAPLAAVEPTPTPPAEGPPIEEPRHVSEESVLVEERADAGVEEGAGPQVTVDEPWEGYAQLRAEEVIARLAQADAAQLAAVELYESAKRGRRSVLAEVKRQLQSGSRSGGSST